MNQKTNIMNFIITIITMEQWAYCIQWLFDAWRIFCSLIIVLGKVNDIYTIYDIGLHPTVRRDLLNNYKLYGLKNINYEPAIFDNGDPKFVYVRHNDSLTLNYTQRIKNRLKLYNFNINKLYNQ